MCLWSELVSIRMRNKTLEFHITKLPVSDLDIFISIYQDNFANNQSKKLDIDLRKKN